MENNYEFLGVVNIESLKDKIINIKECVWDEFDIRQRIYEAHSNTKTIPILWDLESVTSLNVAKKTKYYDSFYVHLYDVVSILKNHYGEGKLLRIILTKLKSNKKIPPHIDQGKGLEICKRIHIPIITNEKVIFGVNGELKNMKEGEMWEINNQQIHSVSNNSDCDRVHLIVDYLKN